MPIISLIVARTRNGVIGRNNTMPWHLPEDLRYFKRVTLGKPVIMGRNTWESLGKPLPGRDNIVITRNSRYSAEGAYIANSLNDAINLATSLASENNSDEIMIIGGAQIYQAALPLVQRAYITEIDADIDGDAFFPPLEGKWHEISCESHAPCEKNPHPYSFMVLEK
ncbi:MAG: dihydrofolate reductase [Pseudomonadales bacterium]